MKILVSIASGANNIERNVLRAFHDGIKEYFLKTYGYNDYKSLKKKHQIDLRLNYDPEIEKCDVAVQFGTVKERTAEHHLTKQSIKKNAHTVIYIETPLLGRVINSQNDYMYYRVGVNGFLHNNGVFYQEEKLDQNRLSYLRNHLEIPHFNGWKDTQDGEILILCQLPGDASLRGQRMSEWLTDTVNKIRKNTQQPIVIRLHPAMSDRGRADLFSELYPLIFKNHHNIRWSMGNEITLASQLNTAKVCVSYSSGSCIDSILHGVPVIAMDEGNLAYPISSHRLDDLENPFKASDEEVKVWLNSLANSQWSEQEMLSGKVWEHIEPIIKEIFSEDSSDIS
jgi:hypothetical protein